MGKRLTQLATRWREKPVWAGARGRGAGAAHKSDGEMGGQPVSGVHEVRAARLRSELQVSAYGQAREEPPLEERQQTRQRRKPPGAAGPDAAAPRALAQPRPWSRESTPPPRPQRRRRRRRQPTGRRATRRP